MPWKEVKVIEQRLEFINAVERGRQSFTSLCDDYGISRKTGYKWINRYRESEDIESLRDQSREPDWSSRRTHPYIVYELCQLRKKYPHWGPKKLLKKLTFPRRRKYKIPSASTVSRILKQNGLIKPRRRRQRTPPYTRPFGKVTAPNQLWCIDFKGHFQCRNGQRIYPLTITDAFSRFILCCEVTTEPKSDRVFRIMRRVFRRYGLPEAIRSDNGVPFASVGINGLSELNVWWTRLGIKHERIEPGKPQQNGRHERMHLTLKREVCNRPSLTPSGQQQAFNTFMREYNFDRPHEALGMQTPSEIYVRSDRVYAKQLQSRFIPGFKIGSVLVQPSGHINWNGNKLFIGKMLAHQCLEVRREGLSKWSFSFGPHKLGSFNERRPTTKLLPM
jgi:transposase InsO family protein